MNSFLVISVCVLYMLFGWRIVSLLCIYYVLVLFGHVVSSCIFSAFCCLGEHILLC